MSHNPPLSVRAEHTLAQFNKLSGFASKSLVLYDQKFTEADDSKLQSLFGDINSFSVASYLRWSVLNTKDKTSRKQITAHHEILANIILH